MINNGATCIKSVLWHSFLASFSSGSYGFQKSISFWNHDTLLEGGVNCELFLHLCTVILRLLRSSIAINARGYRIKRGRRIPLQVFLSMVLVCTSMNCRVLSDENLPSFHSSQRSEWTFLVLSGQNATNSNECFCEKTSDIIKKVRSLGYIELKKWALGLSLVIISLGLPTLAWPHKYSIKTAFIALKGLPWKPRTLLSWKQVFVNAYVHMCNQFGFLHALGPGFEMWSMAITVEKVALSCHITLSFLLVIVMIAKDIYPFALLSAHLAWFKCVGTRCISFWMGDGQRPPSLTKLKLFSGFQNRMETKVRMYERELWFT